MPKTFMAVELDSPTGADMTAYMRRAGKISAVGADMITIADCPLGKPRLDASMAAAKVARELGLRVMPHMTCRDRNAVAIRAALLGLAAEGVRDVLAVTGDPLVEGETVKATGVFDFNSISLASYISELNETAFKAAPFAISAALNINARNFGAEVNKAWRKAAAGVTRFLTQPVFTTDALSNISSAKSLGQTILAGIMPVVSYKSACFLRNGVNGITVPHSIVAAYEQADEARCAELAVNYAVRTAESALQAGADGIYLITPLNKVDIVVQIIERIREL